MPRITRVRLRPRTNAQGTSKPSPDPRPFQPTPAILGNSIIRLSFHCLQTPFPRNRMTFSVPAVDARVF
jgi:hypothetical protein